MRFNQKQHWGSLCLGRARTGWILLLSLMAPLTVWSQGSPGIIWQQTLNSDRINAVVFSPDGSKLYSGSSDRLINIWDANSGTLLQVLNSNAAPVHASSIESLAISPNGSRLASVSYQSVKLWNLSSGAAQSLSGHTDWVVDCSISPNGTYLATASFDSTIRIWRMSDGAAVKVLTGPTQMRACAFSPDSSLLASGGGDAVVTLRKTSDWSTVRQLLGPTDTIYTMAFSPDGSLIASGGYDKRVTVWNVSDGTVKFTVGGNGGNIYGVAFSPDGTTLAYTDGEGNTIKLVRVSDGAVVRTYNSNVDNVQDLAFSPQGVLAYGRVDPTVVVASVDPSLNNPPTSITITFPADGSTFSAPANVTLTASAVASAGVANVEYFQGGNSLGQATLPPYRVSWTGVAVGAYSVTAVVTDKNGDTTTSSPINLTVNDPPPETVKPKIVIKTPVSGARVLSTPVTVTGTASDNVAVASVQVALNGGDFQTADGTTSWQINLDLVPGLNTIQAKSIDTSGNESVVAARSFTYVVTSPLTITINGNGTVSPNQNGQLIEIGKKVSLAARPAVGAVFDGWTGTIATNGAVMTFAMQQDTSLQANFIPNPFIPEMGLYTGLLQSDPPSAAGAGAVRITVASSGAFSGILYRGNTVRTIAGKFNNDGSFATTLVRRGATPLTLTLQLPVADGSDQITGTVSDDTVSSAISADRALFNARTNAAPQAGRYTILLNPDATQTSSPQGIGYGSVTITTGGAVVVSGRLADGTAFSESTTLSKNGGWPLFFFLAAGNETASGEITIENNAASDMDGTFNWFRAPMRAKLFADGFSAQLGLIGSIYVPPATGVSTLNLATGTNNAVVKITGGDVDPEIDVNATVDTRDRVSADPTASQGLRMAINRASGLFSGTFLHPVTGRAVAFAGVVFQKQSVGGGFFLGPDQGGSITIGAAP